MSCPPRASATAGVLSKSDRPCTAVQAKNWACGVGLPGAMERHSTLFCPPTTGWRSRRAPPCGWRRSRQLCRSPRSASFVRARRARPRPRCPGLPRSARHAVERLIRPELVQRRVFRLQRLPALAVANVKAAEFGRPLAGRRLRGRAFARRSRAFAAAPRRREIPMIPSRLNRFSRIASVAQGTGL
jgi:hypothetical protein